MLSYAVITNLGLGIFNLIPLPPLDGSKVLINFLPYNGRRWFLERETIFHIIFLIIWITGLTGYIVTPVLNFMYKGLTSIILTIFGL